MPEPYWPKRKNSYTLSDAETHNSYARLRCTYCKRTRYFLLKGLRAAFGNIECDDVVFQHNWKCLQCDGKGEVAFDLEKPPLGQNAVVRRLVRVEYIRRPIWKDEAV